MRRGTPLLTHLGRILRQQETNLQAAIDCKFGAAGVHDRGARQPLRSLFVSASNPGDLQLQVQKEQLESSYQHFWGVERVFT